MASMTAVAASPSSGQLADFYIGASIVDAVSSTGTIRLTYGVPPRQVPPGTYKLTSVAPAAGIGLGTAVVSPGVTVVIAGAAGNPTVVRVDDGVPEASAPRQLRVVNATSEEAPFRVSVGSRDLGVLKRGQVSKFVETGATAPVSIRDSADGFEIHSTKVPVSPGVPGTLWVFGGGDRGFDSVVSMGSPLAKPTPPTADQCGAFPEIKRISTGLPPQTSTVRLQSGAKSSSGKPVAFKLAIASIGVSANVNVGSDARDGELTVPVSTDGSGANDVDWYPKSVAPGQPGVTLVLGHVNWDKVPGPFSAIGLGNGPKAGDVIEVVRQGVTYRYVVATKLKFKKADVALSKVCEPATASTLVIVTCGGVTALDPSDGRRHYDSNVAVIARLQR